MPPWGRPGSGGSRRPRRPHWSRSGFAFTRHHNSDKTLQSLFDRSVSVWWLVWYAAARRSKGYIVPGVPYWEHTVRGNTHTVPAPGSQLHRPMTIVTGCGAITSNTINASRPYSPCTAYAGTSTTEVRFRTSLSAGSYLTELMFYYTPPIFER